MNPFEAALVLFWVLWLAMYWKLAWSQGGAESRNYAVLILPILLPFDSFWRSGCEAHRFKILVAALALVLIQAILHYAVVLSAT